MHAVGTKRKRLPRWLGWSTVISLFIAVGGIGGGDPGWAIVGVFAALWFVVSMAFYIWVGTWESGKSCPECAETVRPAAKVCKHCGHAFGDPGTERVSL
jgi:Uncharacterised protein family UPF0547